MYSKKAVVMGCLIICLFFLSVGCSKIENKSYVKEQVMKMYEGNTTHPIKDFANRLNDATSSSGGVHNLMTLDVAGGFNKKCVKYIISDSLLVKYFEGFIKRSGDKKLKIYTLNYHGVPVREQLQKELGVELLQ